MRRRPWASGSGVVLIRGPLLGIRGRSATCVTGNDPKVREEISGAPSEVLDRGRRKSDLVARRSRPAMIEHQNGKQRRFFWLPVVNVMRPGTTPGSCALRGTLMPDMSARARPSRRVRRKTMFRARPGRRDLDRCKVDARWRVRTRRYHAPPALCCVNTEAPHPLIDRLTTMTFATRACQTHGRKNLWQS